MATVFFNQRLPKPFVRTAAFAFVLLGCGGCGVRDRAFDPTHFQATGVMVPPEVVVSTKKATRGWIDGIEVVEASRHYTGICCWIADHVRLLVRKSPGTRELSITIYVPDEDTFRRRPQQIVVAFPTAGTGYRFDNLGPFFHSLSAPVPRKLWSKGGSALVQIDCLVPYLESSPGGLRYGVVLTSIYFE